MPKNKFIINWSETATRDFISIVEYIKIDNENSAYNVFNEIKSSITKLETFPESGRIVPELEFYQIKSYREIIYKVWRVIYRIDDNNVYILAVIDSRRNIEDILLNRFMNQ